MIVAALRDLQWRRRRFIIAVLGAALVLGMALLILGLSLGFDTEADRTLDQLSADEWIVKEGAAGPFLGAEPMNAGEVEQFKTLPGVRAAAPAVFTRRSAVVGDTIEDVNVFGAPPGGPGAPSTTEGRPPTAKNEIAVSAELGERVGNSVAISGRLFVIVGAIEDSTALGGAPNVFVTLADAQHLAYGGLPAASGAAVHGHVEGSVPTGYEVITKADAREDFLRAVASARRGFRLVRFLLYLVAALIVMSVVYLSALEKQRDFAVFKAVGVRTRSIAAGVVLQAVLVAILAAGIGIGLAELVGPRFPLTVTIDATALLQLVLLSVVVGVIGSLAGLRRAISVEPALAFEGP